MKLFERPKHDLFAHVVTLVPVTIWHELIKTNLIIPRWHIVSDSYLPHTEGTYRFRTSTQFNKDLEFLLKYYEPISLSELIKSLDHNNKFKSRRFLATFDDGFREQYEVVAPILYKFGVPAVFFLTTSLIDNKKLAYPQKKSLLIWRIGNLKDSGVLREVSRLLNTKGTLKSNILSLIHTMSYHDQYILDEIAALIGIDFISYLSSNKPYLTSDQVSGLIERGFDIGGHSIDHPRFSEICLREQIRQTISSVNWLSVKYNYICNSFAFPSSDEYISPEYFDIVFSESPIKVTFGTGGLIKKGGHARNFPRCSAEGSNATMRQIISMDSARFFLMKNCTTPL